MDARINIPNSLTALRVFLTIPLVYFILAGDQFWSIIIFTIGLVSDADGYVARALKQETAFGDVFDFIADSVFIIGGVLALLIVEKLPLLLMLLLLLVNVPRFVLVNKSVKKSGSAGSTMPSKISGMFIFFILLFAIINFRYLNEYIILTIIVNALIIGQKFYRQELHQKS